MSAPKGRTEEIKDTAGWTADQLRERLKAAQAAGDDDAAMDYARRLMRHPWTGSEEKGAA